jgi:YVTN family beta-propeller protein
VAALAAGGAGLFALLNTHGSRATRATSNSIGIVDTGSGRLRGDVPVGATPTHIAVGEGAYWITDADADTVSRIDPATSAVIETISVGNSPSGITTGNGAVWVANSLDGTVWRIDPKTNKVVQKIDVGNDPLGVVYAAGSVWVANTGDGTISRINADTGRTTDGPAVAATDLAVGAGSLWASERDANRVARIDMSSGDVQPIGVGGGPTGIAFGSGAAWVANSLDGTVSRIDPSTNSVAATIPAVGDGPTDVAVDGHGVWVSNQFDGMLVRIDPRGDRVARRIRVGDRLQGVAAAAGNILVSVDAQAGAGHRGGTLAVRMNRSLDSIDPAVAYDTTSIPIVRMTNDGLVAFDQTSGLAGTGLVPDLAVSLPTPTDGGRTYTFRLRPNIRYSDGRPVKASNIRTTFERDFEIGKLSVRYYDVIVGANRCVRHRRCDLSRGIVADDAANSVTFHLVAPDPDFLDELALEFAYAVPTGAPAREVRTHPLPATGPYMIASYRPKHGLTLVRNPYFHEWSKAAQPDGYPDKIVFKIGGTPNGAVRAVLAGKADAFSTSQSENPPSAAILDAVTLRHASQLHTNPQQATIALFLNTRLAPFDRLDVRRALNYAADRAAAVRITGGPDVARPTCQILPPHFPGYMPYCPYTTHASISGVWTAPDLAKARALVARSGTHGMKITVWSWDGLPHIGPYAVKLLRSLGYRVSMKTFGDNYFEVAFDSRRKPQIGTAEWITDYPSAAGFFKPIFTCASFQRRSTNNTNGAEFCDPRLDRRINDAVAEQTTNADASRRLWGQIDRSTVDAAPWVPLTNPNVVDVLSKRVGNYQYSPAGWGMLIDQLWVK